MKIISWIERLPEEVKPKALHNLNRIAPYNRQVEQSNAKDALVSAFPWKDTKEGFTYWHDVMKKL